MSAKPKPQPKAKTVFFNGRFLQAKATGVQRVARELIVALDKRLARGGDASGLTAELLTPNPVTNAPEFSAIRIKPVGRQQGVKWEQFDFAAIAKKGLAVNLCNVGPAFTRNAITMIHDAQVFTSPGSYSFAFRFYYRRLLPWLGFRHRLILTVSEFSKQELVKYKVAPASKIRVVHNGIDHILRFDADPAIVDKLGLSPHKYVVSLANVQKHKNIRILLEAFKSDALKDLKLVLFGAATRQELLALCNPLPDNLVLAGKVSDEALKGLVEQALCLAFPSKTEGFGLPPLEAMRVGCPAIVAPCGALPEVCGDAVLYADPDRSAAWVEAISALDRLPQQRDLLSRAGVAHATRFTWDASSGALLDAINEAMTKDRRA